MAINKPLPPPYYTLEDKKAQWTPHTSLPLTTDCSFLPHPLGVSLGLEEVMGRSCSSSRSDYKVTRN